MPPKALVRPLLLDEFNYNGLCHMMNSSGSTGCQITQAFSSLRLCGSETLLFKRLMPFRAGNHDARLTKLLST